MWMWQVPAAVLVFVTWFNASPSSLADASRRETIRRQILPPSAHMLSNENLPAARPVFASPVEPVPAASAGAAGDAAATSSDAAAGTPGQVSSAGADSSGSSAHDEAWWKDRMKGARAAADHDQAMVDALQSQINGLTSDWINRDNPVQKAQLEAQRDRALAELDRMKTKLDTDRKAIDAVTDDARRAGVPPGWLRGGGD